MVPGLKDGGDSLGKDLVGPAGWGTGVGKRKIGRAHV